MAAILGAILLLHLHLWDMTMERKIETSLKPRSTANTMQQITLHFNLTDFYGKEGIKHVIWGIFIEVFVCVIMNVCIM